MIIISFSPLSNTKPVLSHLAALPITLLPTACGARSFKNITIISIFFSDFTKSRLPHINVRRPNVLGTLPSRQGTGIPQSDRPLLPAMAEPRHAHEYNGLRPARDVHVLQTIPVETVRLGHPGDLHAVLSSLVTCDIYQDGHLGVSDPGEIKFSSAGGVLRQSPQFVGRPLYRRREDQPEDLVESRQVRENALMIKRPNNNDSNKTVFG